MKASAGKMLFTENALISTQFRLVTSLTEKERKTGTEQMAISHALHKINPHRPRHRPIIDPVLDIAPVIRQPSPNIVIHAPARSEHTVTPPPALAIKRVRVSFFIVFIIGGSDHGGGDDDGIYGYYRTGV